MLKYDVILRIIGKSAKIDAIIFPQQIIAKFRRQNYVSDDIGARGAEGLSLFRSENSS